MHCQSARSAAIRSNTLSAAAVRLVLERMSIALLWILCAWCNGVLFRHTPRVSQTSTCSQRWDVQTSVSGRILSCYKAILYSTSRRRFQIRLCNGFSRICLGKFNQNTVFFLQHKKCRVTAHQISMLIPSHPSLGFITHAVVINSNIYQIMSNKSSE